MKVDVIMRGSRTAILRMRKSRRANKPVRVKARAEV